MVRSKDVCRNCGTIQQSVSYILPRCGPRVGSSQGISVGDIHQSICYGTNWHRDGPNPAFKYADNLKPEGQFASRPKEEWAPGERAPVVKRADNLKPEGA